MRTITVLYDGTPYTFRWLKTLFWARKEFLSLGYKIEFPSLRFFFPLKNSILNIKTALGKKPHDIIFLAFHHSTSELGTCSAEEREALLKYVKERCNKLVWLDTSDSTGTCLFDVLPHVDVYLKKQILKNKELYFNQIWGGRIFCEYYHDKLGLDDEQLTGRVYPALDKEYIGKIKLSWNVGLGDLFISKGRYAYLNPYKFSMPSVATKEYDSKVFDTHFRGSGWSKVAGYQRSKCRSLLEGRSDINCPDVSQKVPYKIYQQEIQNTKTVISPFGWGEICTRDFEAFVYGATLIKPSMEHSVTYPNFYVENETYIPLDWNFDNFFSTLESIKEQKNLYKEIARNGANKFQYYRKNPVARLEVAKHVVRNIE
jgi:hypothetical protein